MGGREPYVVECAPGPGSVFPIGESIIDCKATDADMAQAACGFTVSVSVSRTLSRTKFVAFGDSITAGVISLAPSILLDEPETYPSKLSRMLQGSYPSQSFQVVNSGRAGERTNQGVERLPGVLDAEHPEVLLLLEGVNAVRALSANRQEGYLRTMITDAQRRAVEVVIATVMPVAPGGKLQPSDDYNAAIQALNQRIFGLAAEKNLGPVVDLHALFQANMYLLGGDGLHPTAEGQTRIAEAFRDEIARRYESRATMRAR